LFYVAGQAFRASRRIFEALSAQRQRGEVLRTSQLLQKPDLLLCIVKEFNEAQISPLIVEEGTEILLEIPALIVQNLALKSMLRIFPKIIDELADVFLRCLRMAKKNGLAYPLFRLLVQHHPSFTVEEHYFVVRVYHDYAQTYAMEHFAQQFECSSHLSCLRSFRLSTICKKIRDRFSRHGRLSSSWIARIVAGLASALFFVAQAFLESNIFSDASSNARRPAQETSS